MSALEIMEILANAQAEILRARQQSKEAGIMTDFVKYLLTEGVLTAQTLHEIKQAWAAFNHKPN